MTDHHRPLPRDRAYSVEDAIKKIRFSPFEHLYIFKKGKQVRRFKGEHNFVSVDDRYLVEMKDSVIVHNHPQGASYSIEDIYGMIKYNVAEFILVTEKYIYKVIRPENGWEIDVDCLSFEQQLSACKSFADSEINKVVANNTMNLHEKEVEIFHYIWMLYFRELNNIYYVREKVT